MHGFRPKTGSIPQRRIEGERIPTLTPCHRTVHGFNEDKEKPSPPLPVWDKDNLFKQVYEGSLLNGAPRIQNTFGKQFGVAVNVVFGMKTTR